MTDRPVEQDIISKFLSDQKLADFIFSNLRQSLKSIGFSAELIADLIDSLVKIGVSTFDIEKFGDTHKKELREVYTIGFFQKFVPDYFLKYVVPITPIGGKIVDVGCGTGILAKLYAESKNFDEVVGIDINPYPEWDMFAKSNIRFQVVKEKDFIDFLSKEQPDSMSITWTLHHMEFGEQKRFLEYIYKIMKNGSRTIILEDSYSTTLAPENGTDLYAHFTSLSLEDRTKTMSVYDWIANRVLAQRNKVPIPFGYRTVEEWEKLFAEVGFKKVSEKFIGFPENRDINTPQSIMVFEK